jgi:hypothetical protein
MADMFLLLSIQPKPAPYLPHLPHTCLRTSIVPFDQAPVLRTHWPRATTAVIHWPNETPHYYLSWTLIEQPIVLVLNGNTGNVGAYVTTQCHRNV